MVPDGKTAATSHCLNCLAHAGRKAKLGPHITCHRAHLSDIEFFRTGNLGITSCWSSRGLPDVSVRRVLFMDQQTEIHWTLGICPEPVPVRVVRFKVEDGDDLKRYWTVQCKGKEVRRECLLPPYCILDIQATYRVWEEYVDRNAIRSFLRQKSGPVRTEYSDANFPKGVVERTYIMAMAHYERLSVS